MTTVTKNLYQRRNEAKKEVYEHEFSKVRTEGLRYAYMPVESIKPIIEKAYNNTGIVMDIGSLVYDDVLPPWEKTSQYGETSTWHFVRGSLTITLVNMDDPSDKATFTVVGEAKDNSDKVINKVYTAAYKNFLKLEFNVSEGPKDDTDAIQTEADLEKSEKPKAEADPEKKKPRAASTMAKKVQTDDPFFRNSNGSATSKPGNPATTSNAEKKEAAAPKDDISDGELNTGLLKASKDPRFSKMITDFVAIYGVPSVTLLERAVRLDLRAKIEGASQ